MDVTKAPPSADSTSLGVGTATNAAAASQSNAAAGASTASNISAAVTAVVDRVDIQPLDVAAALQILIAEVRAELPLSGASLPGLTQQVNSSPALQAAGLALLESQGMPLSRAALAELPDLPNLLGTGSIQPPILEPLPETPDLATVTLHLALPLSEGETSAGAAAASIDASESGAGGATPPLPSPLFTTPGPLPPPRGNPGMEPLRMEPLRMEPPWTEPLPMESPWIGPPGSSDGNVGAGIAPERSTGGWLPLTALPTIPPNLDLDPLEPLLMPPGARVAMPSALTLLSTPAQASPVLMRMFLQAVPPEASNPAAWSATVKQLEDTLQSALDRAVATVEQWHDVPQAVVDAARETRGLVMTQLGEDPPGPLWLRPEWMWLSPQIERFRRRRRLVRRGLSDPDLWPLREDGGRRDEPGERKEEP